MILHASPHATELIESPDCQLYTRVFRQIMNFTWMSDRSESIVTPFQQFIPDEYKIPENKPVGNLEEVCIERCVELASRNKPIFLQWSGGIDSTLMLTFFLKSGVDKNQITICMNPDSIKENPNFFYDHIFGKFKLIATEKHVSSKNDGVTVQAEHADQIISGMILSKIDPELANQKATPQNLLRVCEQLGFGEREAECFIFVMMQTALKSPRPIDTVSDFSWWFNFNFRWLNAKEKYRSRIGFENEYETFYSSENIQRWSIQNPSPQKDLFKEIIFDYTKDEAYFQEKRKWNSMGKLFFTRKPSLVEKDLTCHYNIDEHLMRRFYIKDNFFWDFT